MNLPQADFEGKFKNDNNVNFAKLDNDIFKSVDIDIAHLFPFYDEDHSFIGNIYVFSKSNSDSSLTDYFKNYRNTHTINKDILRLTHEINNPLGIILNYLQLIKSENSFDHVKENTSNIEREVKRIRRIINDIYSTNKYSEEKENNIKLETIVQEISKLLKPSLDRYKIDLQLNINKDAYININSDLIKQVVLNLMLNAIEAMPNGGNLQIINQYKSIANKQYSVIEFKDSGIGIKESNIHHVFDPFYSTKNIQDHKGLGLSLSQDIIKSNGGYIEIKSTYKKGSIFTIFLPE